MRRPITKSARKPGEYPYYGATGIVDYVDGYIFDEQLVLLGEDGAKWGAGDLSAFSATGKYWVNNHAHIVRPNRSKLLDDWLIYYLNMSDLAPFITGLTVPKLNQERMREIPIPLPPLEEQRRIVAVLDEAFAAIARATAIAETNLANARALFQSALAREIGAGEGVGVRGWPFKTFDEVLDIRNGKNQREVESATGQYPILGSAGKIMGYATDFICESGTTIIGRKGTINTPIFVDTRFWNVDTAFGLSARKCLDAKFLHYFCLSYDFSLHNRGTTIPSLVKTDLLQIRIPLPPLEEQRRIVGVLEAVSAMVAELRQTYEQKLAALATLKQSLLHKAFAGELV